MEMIVYTTIFIQTIKTSTFVYYHRTTDLKTKKKNRFKRQKNALNTQTTIDCKTTKLPKYDKSIMLHKTIYIHQSHYIYKHTYPQIYKDKTIMKLHQFRDSTYNKMF